MIHLFLLINLKSRSTGCVIFEMIALKCFREFNEAFNETFNITKNLKELLIR